MTQTLQRTNEWDQVRLGKVTASRFKDVITSPRSKEARDRGDLSTTAQTYLCQKVAEVLSGRAVKISTKATQWGIDCEPLAIEAYQERQRHKVVEVGFIEHPTIEGVGGSPDGLVNAEGLIEVKCPYASQVHVNTYLTNTMPAEHRAQVQGLLWITGRRWCDFVSFDPRLNSEVGLHVKRIPRDEPFIALLAAAVQRFRGKLSEELERVQAQPEHTWELPESWVVQEPMELVVGGKVVVI